MESTSRTSPLLSLLMIVSVIYIFLLHSELEDVREQREAFEDKLQEQTTKVSALTDAIEEFNLTIADAKAYEGGTYEEMSEALANLEELDAP